MEVVLALKFAAPGVNPGTVERCTRYCVTATLSVAAVQFSDACPMPPAADRLDGALGGWTSSVVAGTRTNEPIDGTPEPLIRNSM